MDGKGRLWLDGEGCKRGDSDLRFWVAFTGARQCRHLSFLFFSFFTVHVKQTQKGRGAF